MFLICPQSNEDDDNNRRGSWAIINYRRSIYNKKQHHHHLRRCHHVMMVDKIYYIPKYSMPSILNLRHHLAKGGQTLAIGSWPPWISQKKLLSLNLFDNFLVASMKYFSNYTNSLQWSVKHLIEVIDIL